MAWGWSFSNDTPPGYWALARLSCALLTSLTLAEYFTGHAFGVDQLFFKSYIDTATEFPGRMSPLAASCFLLISTAITLTWRGSQSKGRLTAVGILSCIVATIAIVALFGYALGIESASGWGSYTRMAIHTAATFLILAAGLLVWTWYTARLAEIYFLRWLPLTGSVTLMVMLTFVSAASVAQLENSTSWRKHSYDVLATAQAFLGDCSTPKGACGDMYSPAYPLLWRSIKKA